MLKAKIITPGGTLRVAGLLVLAASAAGCSDISRFSEGPIFTASTPNQQAVMGSQDMAMATPLQSSPAGSVSSSSLPPPSGAGAAPVQTASLAATGAAVTYKNWSTVNGTTITAQPGDTAASLSNRYGVPADAIVAVNRLGGPTVPLAGRQIVIPAYFTGAAPQVAAAPAVAQPVATAGLTAGTHTVTPGETLYSIARKYHVAPSAIAQANGLAPNTEIKIGATLRIPGASAAGTQVASVAPTAVQPIGAPPTTLNDQATKISEPPIPPADPNAAAATTPAAPGVPAAPADAAGASTQVASLPAAAGAGGKVASDAAKADSAAGAQADEDQGGSGFRWPVRGRIVAGFGKKPNGEQNDGINIAVPEGTPVKAAEAGVVIYAGNELTGFGNLVLIRHEGGWVTAYAHNKDLLVKRGEQVRRGQVIANAGATGTVSQPQVHFELRKGSQPVDPLPHLSGA
ncbi:LysM peptidoglycan-binding domain-containing M23 family metallopeptidase [Segnochrobactrum spirostomi]|uniref:LysM peptidoglycan-binding domain-containing M23 family metallopeptidase n=1 Tax=Segnochrobactrum spirostomi TaxID=2608987 RepID=A0A6A7Y5I4_9HYPH|nr:LysM peptidoglycan-binding domain-containing M23 family metallopeptidase [Segnochrobactrum spirostomi]MQT14454.1 LysM peptidoglycan-binding domain-containing M23 family metallopeptidase [Segnochrobactrum spirostomi]